MPKLIDYLIDDNAKNPYAAKTRKNVEKVNAKWVDGLLVDNKGNVIQRSMPISEAVLNINSFMPVTGDIQAGVMAANDLRKGDYGSAALNSLGLLPFVPAMGGVVKDMDLLKAARDNFGVTFSPKETGYIVENPWSKNAERLDFSGRNQAAGYQKGGSEYLPKYEPTRGQPDYLKYERTTDHRDVSQVMPNMSQWEAMSNFMDRTGGVRYLQDYGISLVNTNKPSPAQIKEIVQDFKRSNTPLIIDIDNMKNGENVVSMEFENPNFDEVYKWIESQYK